MLLLIVLVEVFSRTVFDIPNKGAFYLIAVAYGAASGGRRVGLWCSLLQIAASFCLFTQPAFSFQYDDSLQVRLSINTFTSLTIAFLVGSIKKRNDLLTTQRISREQEARAQRAVQQATEAQAKVLRASEERLRLCNQVARIGTWDSYPQTGVFEWDAASREIFGLAPDTPVSYAVFLSGIHPDDRPAVEQARKTALRGDGTYLVEYRGIGVDEKRERWLLSQGTVQFDENKQPVRFLGIVQDISDRKMREALLQESLQALSTSLEAQQETEKALRRSEARARRVIDAGIVGIINWNLETGQITDANDTFLQMTGYSHADIKAGHLNFHAMTPPEWQGRNADGLTTIQRRGSTPPYEKEYFRKDGTRVPIVIGGALFADSQTEGVSFVLDITERKQLEDERDAALKKQQRIAETLQRSLLITTPPGTFSGLEVATQYEPAWDDALIGGDFYDAFPVGDGKVALLVGDATGKGLQAAAYTAEVKFALRAFLRENPDAGDALHRLNRFLLHAQTLDARSGNALVCVSLVLVSPETGQIEVASAGMEPPLLLSHGGSASEVWSGGMILGMAETAEYQTETRTLFPGDVLLLATDGITEARQQNKDRGFFGYDGFVRSSQAALQAAVQDQPENPLEAAGKIIVNDARRFAGGTLQDDVCLLLVRRRHSE